MILSCAASVLYHPSEEDIDKVVKISNAFDKHYIVLNSFISEPAMYKLMSCCSAGVHHFIYPKYNIGIGGGLNLCLSQALEDRSLYVMAFDQDTELLLTRSQVSQLFHSISDIKQVGIVGVERLKPSSSIDVFQPHKHTSEYDSLSEATLLNYSFMHSGCI